MITITCLILWMPGAAERACFGFFFAPSSSVRTAADPEAASVTAAAMARTAAIVRVLGTPWFDPAHTHLVQSGWLEGIGCPTGAKVFDGSSTSTYTDPACPTGDSRDKVNEGLLLVKTGPTPNVASAGAVLKDVKGTTLTELG